jgi:RNA polymerase sigma-70 factor (ECF subfamily)
LSELFERHHERLRIMVSLRLDRRLASRLSAADVLQDAYLEAMRCFEGYDPRKTPSFYLWLRSITERRLRHLHHLHGGAQVRDPHPEVDFRPGSVDIVTSGALAARLVGQAPPSLEAAIRTERHVRLYEALNTLSAPDREIIALRHFERLSNAETAEVLGIPPPAASKRHIQAMVALRTMLDSGAE